MTAFQRTDLRVKKQRQNHSTKPSEHSWFEKVGDLISLHRPSNRLSSVGAWKLTNFQCSGTVRAMVTAHHRLQLSRACSHVPKIFFSHVFRHWIDCKVVQEAINRVKSKRDLKVAMDPLLWDKEMDRRVTRASTIVKTLAMDAYVFGYKGFSEEELDQQIVRWMIYDWAGVSIKQMKLHLVWLSGRQRGVESPVEGLLDQPGLILTNRYRSWLLQRLRSQRTARGYSLAEMISETLLLGTKRGMPSMEDIDLAGAEETYLREMSTPKPMTGDDGDYMKSQIERTALEVFGEIREVEFRPYTISQKAGFKAPRYSGGILGALVRDGICDAHRVLVRMGDHRRGVYSVYGVWCDSESAWKNAVLTWGSLEDHEPIADCQIYMIREPLKVRTITAGTPTLYGGLGPILKYLRERLTSFNCFHLTKATCDWSIVERRLNLFPRPRRFGEGDELDMFESDDYQASTNEMSMDATSCALYAVFKGGLYWLANAALGVQRLHGRTDSVLQEVGQLMGSPISFPFLCVINAAVARAAFERTFGRRFRLDELPFLVNGDDYLGRSNDVVRCWRIRLMRAVGWRQSPGKSYYLSDLVQVNSQTRNVIRLRDAQTGLEVLKVSEPIPFVNDGYLHLLKKATHQIDGASLDTMSEDWRERWISLSRLGPLERRAREVMLLNLRSMCSHLFRTGATPFLMEPLNPVGLGGLGLTNSIYDFNAARWGIACRSKRRDRFVELVRQEGSRDDENPVLLERCGHVPPTVGALLDELVKDLEQFVASLDTPDLVCPAGHVDPELVWL